MRENSMNKDATDLVAAYFLKIVSDFYETVGDKDLNILMFWDECENICMKGWKKKMKQKYPHNFNAKLAECTDLSLRTVERISLKD